MNSGESLIPIPTVMNMLETQLDKSSISLSTTYYILYIIGMEEEESMFIKIAQCPECIAGVACLPILRKRRH